MKIKLTISIVILVLFTLTGCRFSSVSPASADITNTTKTFKTENITTDSLKYYKNEASSITQEVTQASDNLITASNNFMSYKIDLSSYKSAIKTYNNIIVYNYDRYKKLVPPTEMTTVHSYFGQAIEHYYNSSEYLNNFINTEDMDSMKNYLRLATAELLEANEAFKKATAELKNID